MRRLAYYAIGLAIGFVLLGMFQRLRTQEHAARLAAREAQAAGQGTVATPAPTAGPAAGVTESVEPQGAKKP